MTILVLDKTISSFYPIHPSVRLIQQPFSFGITPDGNVISRKIKLLTDVLKLRGLLRKLEPGIVIATEYPFAAAAILTGVKKRAKVISWEHHHFYELKRNVFWNKVFKITYPRLNNVICLNEDEKQLFKTINPNPLVIPNFINQSEQAALTNKLLLTVGRLTSVKGTDLLLETARIVLQKHPDWQWKLIGDGDMKDQVIRFINENNFQNRLLIQSPLTHDIIDQYREASLYVMTSRNECLPMTLMEAQSVGLPSVAFDCDSGPRHIILHQENGLLVEKENIEKLAITISILIDQEATRKKMGENAYSNISRFSPERIYSEWRKLFD